MSTKSIVVCDKCGEPIEGVHSPTLSFFVSVDTDAAGGRDEEYTYGDLCPTCMLKWWNYMKHKMGWEKNTELTRQWKEFTSK